MSAWLNPVDIYCERLDASYWSEPLNAITNLSFIIAAFFIWRLGSPRASVMAVLLVLIGLGSFSFHTYANRLTGLLDVLAIALYLVAFAFLIPKQWIKQSIWIQIGSVTILIVSISLVQWGSASFKPSLPWLPPGMYVGAWLALVMYTAITRVSNLNAARYLGMAALIFPLSLAARQLDLPLCDSSGGTHWLWHVLNGLTLYLSSYGLCVRRH